MFYKHFLIYFLFLLLSACNNLQGPTPEVSTPANTSTPLATNLQVTYDTNGATGGSAPTDSNFYTQNDTVTVLNNTGSLVKTGANFAGWNTRADGTGTNYTAGSGTFSMPGANITLYARWSSLPVYTVNFDSQGGSAVSAQSVIEGDPATTPVPDPALTGYLFAGWFHDTAGTTPWNFASDTITANTTIFAGWNSYSYTVTYDSQAADVAASPSTAFVSSPATTVASLPTPPTKAGFTFGGWWTGMNGTGTQFTASTSVTGNSTIYAYWIGNPTYSITFDKNATGASGTMPAQMIVEGTTMPLSANTYTYPGYNFDGWSTTPAGSVVYSDVASYTMGSSNVTLYAKWSNIYIYTVTFDSQSADVAASPTTKAVASPATTIDTLPTSPTKIGFYFSGWWTEVNGTGSQFTPLYNVSSDITVYAYWMPTGIRASWLFTAGSEYIDSSGNANILNETGTPAATFTPTAGRNSITLAGINTRLTAGPSSSLNTITNGQTVSFWYYGNSFSQGAVISRYNSLDERVWTIGANMPGQLNILDSAGYPGGSAYNYATELQSMQWNHMAVVFDTVAGDVRVYINGVLINAPLLNSGASTKFNDSGLFYLGDNPDTNPGGNALTPASLASIKIYNYALTGLEVTNLYNTD